MSDLVGNPGDRISHLAVRFRPGLCTNISNKGNSRNMTCNGIASCGHVFSYCQIKCVCIDVAFCDLHVLYDVETLVHLC